MADKTPDQILKETAETAEILKDAFISLGASIKKNLNQNLIDADDYTKQYVRSLKSGVSALMNSLGKGGDKLIDNQLKLNKGQISSKEITKQIQELEEKKIRSINQVTIAEKNRYITKNEAKKLEKQINEAIAEGTAELEKQAIVAKEIEYNIGILGNAVKGLNKIPVLGGLINSEKVLGDIQEAAAKKGANRFTTLGAGLFSLGKSITTNLLDPLTLLTFFFTQGFKADKQVTELAKSLALTKGEANSVRGEFTQFSREIGDAAITTDKLLESFSQLSKQLGFNVPRSKDLLQNFTVLTQKMGISAESAAKLSQLSLATGKSSRTVTTEALGTAQALQAQNGIQLDNREVLNDIGKVSGQLLANFKGNPRAIAEAVTQTKLLGTTLEQTKAQAESLLNFESSIDNELKSELLTGRELNLENARMAALKGDQATVAKELSAQAMDFNTFSNLNVIQQKALAESLGLSADALSDQLLKQQMLGKSRSEVLAIGGEEVANRLEQLSAQDKFNAAVSKLQDLIGNLVAGPLGRLIDGFASIASNATVLYGVIGALAGISLVKTIASLGAMAVQMGIVAAGAISAQSAMTLGIAIPVILAAIAAGMGAFTTAKSEAAKPMSDGFIGSDGSLIMSSAGSFKTRPDDNILVGTNVKPPTSDGGSRLEGLMQSLISVTKENNNKSGVINMDGRAVGSTLVQGSYKLA